MPESKETIGGRLKNLRADRRLSLEKAAEATRIRVPYLQALEEDNYSVMSSAAQGRGFLKIYADFLGLDLDAAMQELRQAETAEVAPAPVAPQPADSTLEPLPAQPTPPASSEPTAGRRPFWARLLRRSAPEADISPAPEPVAESAPAEAEVSPALGALLEAESPQPEPVAAPAKKPAARKAGSPSKASRPRSKPAGARAKKPADKKKVSLRKPPAKKASPKRRASLSLR